MKVYVYKDSYNEILFLASEQNRPSWTLLGTLDLPIEPIKREVVKETYLTALKTEQMIMSGFLEKGAYDVKIIRTVKE